MGVRAANGSKRKAYSNGQAHLGVYQVGVSVPVDWSPALTPVPLPGPYHFSQGLGSLTYAHI